MVKMLGSCSTKHQNTGCASFFNHLSYEMMHNDDIFDIIMKDWILCHSNG